MRTFSIRGHIAGIFGLFLVLGLVACQEQTAPKELALSIGDGRQWYLLGGEWEDGAEGEIVPPQERDNRYAAFYKERSFSEFTAEFKFQQGYHSGAAGDVGLVFAAQDPQHYWWIHFPWVGQQMRAKHFWAAISKLDGSGMVRLQRFSLVNGVPSEYQSWIHAKVSVEGDEVQIWVNGRPLEPFRDPALTKGGRVGWAGFGESVIKDFRIEGQSEVVEDWDTSAEAPQNWTIPVPEPPDKELDYRRQGIRTLTRTPGGELLMIIGFGGGERDVSVAVRSTDNGRTWSDPKELPQDQKLGAMHLTNDGRLIMQVIEEKKVYMSESTDEGRTWSDLAEVPSGEWPDEPKRLGPGGSILELEDGTLVRNLLGGHPSSFGDIMTWSSHHCQAFSIRSTDGGRSWSSPVTLDTTKPYKWGKPGPVSGNLDLTEIAAAETDPGRILCLIRPIYSPWMWETWSTDGGASFAPTRRGRITGYGGPCMVKTASGAVLIMKRYPDLSVNLSWDGGRSWDEGTIIDFAPWANGQVLEVEPDTVLLVYMGPDHPRPGKVRTQLVRVTREGLQPVQ